MRARYILLLVLLVLLIASPRVCGAETVTPPSKVDLQLALVEGYNHGLSGNMTLGEVISPSAEDPNRFTANLLIGYKFFNAGEFTFRRTAEGSYIVESLKVPEWYQKEAENHAGSTENRKGIIDTIVGGLLPTASAFVSWIDGQAVGSQPGVSEALRVGDEADLAVAIAIRGWLVTVRWNGWNLLLEAREQDGGWALEVIAFERATP